MDEKHHICCPRCGRRTKVMVRTDTKLVNFPLFCPWCKKETIINKQ